MSFDARRTPVNYDRPIAKTEVGIRSTRHRWSGPLVKLDLDLAALPGLAGKKSDGIHGLLMSLEGDQRGEFVFPIAVAVFFDLHVLDHSCALEVF